MRTPAAQKLDALVAELEKATEGSREFDAAIYIKLQAPLGLIPHYTTSLDAALTLVPEGMAWTILSGALHAACVGDASTGNPVTKAATPALALCIAALKARAAANDQVAK